MTNFLMDATELQIFDEQGKLITEIKHNTRTRLLLDGMMDTFSIENVTLDLELLKSLGDNGETKELSDFEDSLNKGKTKIKFKKNSMQREYKIISKGILYDAETEEKSHSFNIVIHQARTISPVELDAKCGEAFTPSYTFYLDTDEKDNFVDLELTELNN